MQNCKIIGDILQSEDFRKKLESINSNYPNLKQENFIRNTLLEILNNKHFQNSDTIKAFAEHPRKKGRTDLSIVNMEDDSIYKIELKFQFTKDDSSFKNYSKIIEKDYTTKESDLFIMIVCRFDFVTKKAFDKYWTITSNLNRFNSKTEHWKENISNCFKEYSDNSVLHQFEFTFTKPYPTIYNLYLLEKK